MPATTSAKKARSRKAEKAAEMSRIMEEAPLFAGLDGFVLERTENVKVKSETKKEAKKGKKVSAKTEQVKQPSPKKPKSQPKAPKAQKEPAGETVNVLLSVKEMCRLLKISRATLVRMDKSGQLPGRIKLGGSVRFHRETVETWLQSLIEPQSSPL
jgi:excisionase family DNA binding protein